MKYLVTTLMILAGGAYGDSIPPNTLLTFRLLPYALAALSGCTEFDTQISGTVYVAPMSSAAWTTSPAGGPPLTIFGHVLVDTLTLTGGVVIAPTSVMSVTVIAIENMIPSLTITGTVALSTSLMEVIPAPGQLWGVTGTVGANCNQTSSPWIVSQSSDSTPWSVSQTGQPPYTVQPAPGATWTITTNGAPLSIYGHVILDTTSITVSVTGVVSLGQGQAQSVSLISAGNVFPTLTITGAVSNTQFQTYPAPGTIWTLSFTGGPPLTVFFTNTWMGVHLDGFASGMVFTVTPAGAGIFGGSGGGEVTQGTVPWSVSQTAQEPFTVTPAADAVFTVSRTGTEWVTDTRSETGVQILRSATITTTRLNGPAETVQGSVTITNTETGVQVLRSCTVTTTRLNEPAQMVQGTVTTTRLNEPAQMIQGTVATSNSETGVQVLRSCTVTTTRLNEPPQTVAGTVSVSNSETGVQILRSATITTTRLNEPAQMVQGTVTTTRLNEPAETVQGTVSVSNSETGVQVLRSATITTTRLNEPAQMVQGTVTTTRLNEPAESVQGTVSIQPSILTVTATGVAGGAITATLAAVVGQYHYITHIRIQTYHTTNAGAPSAPVIVTTTNLGSKDYPFSDSWSKGQLQVYDQFYISPVRSAATNTATTVVAPASAGTRWFIYVDYYAAP